MSSVRLDKVAGVVVSFLHRGKRGSRQCRVLPLGHLEIAPEDVVNVIVLDSKGCGLGKGIVVGLNEDGIEKHVRKEAQVSDDGRLHAIDQVPESARQSVTIEQVSAKAGCACGKP